MGSQNPTNCEPETAQELIVGKIASDAPRDRQVDACLTDEADVSQRPRGPVLVLFERART